MALTGYLGSGLIGGAENGLVQGALIGLHILLALVLLRICQSDLRQRQVANTQVMAVAVLAILAASLAGREWSAAHFIGLLLVCASLMLIWRLGMIGGGDVKLIAACLLWVEPDRITTFILLVSVLGSGLGLLILARDKASVKADRQARNESATSVPYALAIAPALAATLALAAA